jgi:glucosamine-6-phosphate deaminase
MTLKHGQRAEDVVERINEYAPTPERKFVLGLPTGSSPEIVYRCLVEAFKASRISFQHVMTFNMVNFF